MNILTVEKVTKGYADRTLFSDITLGINQNDKIGIIGVNGTGKTTLLKIISEIVKPDSGNVTKGNDVTVAYLPQNPKFEQNETIIDYVIKDKKTDKENWNVESEAKAILTKLGIIDFGERIEHLSGGQRKRVALARTLIAPSDVLVLDEPTNHLDNDMVMWLEQFLSKFKGVLVMVTHDRYFLDRVTNKIVEIDNQTLYSYNTNYSGFIELKLQRETMATATYEKGQNILRKEKEWIMRGAKARSTKQKARIERYEDLKATKAPMESKNVEIDSIKSRLGKKTIEVNNVSKSFGDRTLISGFSHIFLKNERVGIIGENGCGKSTLIKIITGILLPDSGSVEVGDTIRIGYFAQECDLMDGEMKVIDYIKEVAEFVDTNNGKVSASTMLEKFLFTPTMQWTKIDKLSGGERRRLYLLRVLMSAPNVLILDEPTNDLDISTLAILEDYLDEFRGIVITVSHDRYFLDRIVERIFSFEGNGIIKQYEGGFSDYYEKRLDSEQQVAQVDKKKEIVNKKAVKQKNIKIKLSFNEQRELDNIDDDIAKLEEQISAVEEEIEQSASQYSKLNELMEQKDDLENRLEEKMDRWVYLNDLVEKIKNNQQE